LIKYVLYFTYSDMPMYKEMQYYTSRFFKYNTAEISLNVHHFTVTSISRVINLLSSYSVPFIVWSDVPSYPITSGDITSLLYATRIYVSCEQCIENIKQHGLNVPSRVLPYPVNCKTFTMKRNRNKKPINFVLIEDNTVDASLMRVLDAFRLARRKREDINLYIVIPSVEDNVFVASPELFIQHYNLKDVNLLYSIAQVTLRDLLQKTHFVLSLKDQCHHFYALKAVACGNVPIVISRPCFFKYSFGVKHTSEVLFGHGWSKLFDIDNLVELFTSLEYSDWEDNFEKNTKMIEDRSVDVVMKRLKGYLDEDLMGYESS